MSFDSNWIYILAIILQIGVVIYFIKQGRKKSRKTEAPLAPSTYEGHRQLAINIEPQQLKIEIPDTQTLVYGMVMDWDMGPDVVTLAAYINGAANMYFKSGEGITGGGKNPIVGEAAVAFVTTAQEYLDRAMQVSAAELPPKACVRFYFLTNHGKYAAQEHVKYITDATSPWLPLFEKGSAVMAEMRDSRNISLS